MVPGIEAVSRISSSSGSTGVGGVSNTQSSGVQSADRPHDSDQFAALMQPHTLLRAQNINPQLSALKTSLLEKLSGRQVADMRDLFQSSKELVSMSPNLSMSEIAAAGNEMTLKIAMTSTQFTISAAVSKSGSSAIQTLMKNQ